MQKLGWVYIFTSLADRISRRTSISNVRNYLYVILIFVAMGSLRPKKPFVVMLIFNATMLVFGIVLGVLLVVECGPQVYTEGNPNIRFFGETFAWYWPVHWIYLTLWIAVCYYALVTYARQLQALQPPPVYGGQV